MMMYPGDAKNLIQAVSQQAYNPSATAGLPAIVMALVIEAAELRRELEDLKAKLR